MNNLLFASAVILLGTAATAQDFVYRPNNPSFGGDSFNSGHLLGLADRQNRHQDDGSSSFSSRGTSSEQFQRQIQSALLSRVSSQISDQILGEDAADSGRFTIGSTRIEFVRIDGIVRIELIDGATGGSTTLEIPDPGL